MCACGKGSGSKSVVQTATYQLESLPSEDKETVYIQAQMQVITRTFNRIFKAGSNIIMPQSYANELVSLQASVVIQQ